MKPVIPKNLRPAQVARFVSPAKSLEAYEREHTPKITELNTQYLAMCAIKVQCVGWLKCNAWVNTINNTTLSDLKFERHL